MVFFFRPSTHLCLRRHHLRPRIICVPEDMLVFSRFEGSRDARKDTLQAWMTPAYVY